MSVTFTPAQADLHALAIAKYREVTWLCRNQLGVPVGEYFSVCELSQVQLDAVLAQLNGVLDREDIVAVTACHFSYVKYKKASMAYRDGKCPLAALRSALKAYKLVLLHYEASLY